MLLPRLATIFSVVGTLLVLTAQGLPMVAKQVGSTSPSAVTVVLTIPSANDVTAHDDDVALKEASKSAAVRRRLYRAQIVKPTPAPAPIAQTKTLLPVVDQKDIQERHRILADETLRSIDANCRNSLKNFYVRYDNPENRGLGGGGTIILTGNVPDDEFRALLVHECGHVIDTGAWKGTAKSGLTSFSDGNEPVYLDDTSYAFYTISWELANKKKQDAKDADFVSGYAAWNAFEDFAETFAYYTLHREEFLARAQDNAALMAKYRFMETHIQNTRPAATEHVWNGNIPWDITKLPYRWLAATSREVSLTVPAR